MDADELYALAPEDFTAARDAAAAKVKAERDRSGWRTSPSPWLSVAVKGVHRSLTKRRRRESP